MARSTAHAMKQYEAGVTIWSPEPTSEMKRGRRDNLVARPTTMKK